MAMTRYEPFSALTQLQREMSNLLSGRNGFDQSHDSLMASIWSPRVDINEEDDQFLLRVDVPGVDPKDIEISLESSVLTVCGKRETEKSTEENKYVYTERPSGTFMRRFTLPNTADAAKVAAKTKNGVLEIVVPKAAEAKPRRITVEH
jgi:HSP20 family protein